MKLHGAGPSLESGDFTVGILKYGYCLLLLRCSAMCLLGGGCELRWIAGGMCDPVLISKLC